MQPQGVRATRPRLLTVQAQRHMKHATRANHREVSYVQAQLALRGRWLEDLGFGPGAVAAVSHAEHGMIVLTLAKPAGCKRCGDDCAPRCGEHPHGCRRRANGQWIAEPGCKLRH